MEMPKIFNKPLVLLAAAIMVCLIKSQSMATSSMGAAIVILSSGQPCFSIKSDIETKNGMPLDGIIVEENVSTSPGEYPAQFWQFQANDSSQKYILKPTECIRYGAAPANTTERVIKDLDFFHVYRVSLMVESKRINTIAYRANFCMKADALGKVTIQMIPHNYRGGNDTHELCRRAP